MAAAIKPVAGSQFMSSKKPQFLCKLDGHQETVNQVSSMSLPQKLPQMDPALEDSLLGIELCNHFSWVLRGQRQTLYIIVQRILSESRALSL